MRLLLFCFVLLFSCGKGSDSVCLIGVDETWYPLGLTGREVNVSAFSDELLKEIGRVEKIQISKVSRSWNNLIPGLQEGKYAAVLSSMPPYLFYEKQYDFSDLYLETGPVLVVSAGSTINSLDMLKGKEVGVEGGTPAALMLEKIPGVLIRYYDSVPRAFNDLLTETIEAAVVNVLAAQAYCTDLYQGQLKIATPPLNNEGLRLIVLHGQNQELLNDFNDGLKKLKTKDSYQKLAQKWSLEVTIMGH